ncbi:MAG: AEC family transporter [Clostridia bacterium]|nr:AEC family transporter [Clostridia bacterium]
MDFGSLLQIILTLFLMIATGVLCRKVGIIDNIASKKLSELIIKIGQPMMIVAALAKQEFTDENLQLAGIATLIGIVMHIVMAGLAYLLCLPLKKQPTLRNVIEFTSIFANCGFLGFPIMEALLGQQGLFMAAFYVIGFNLGIWTWGLYVIGRGTGSVKITVKKVFLNFGTVPCTIGAILFLMRWPFASFQLPPFLMNFLNYLGNLCTPISVLITGALLATIPLGQLFKTKAIYYGCLIKLVIIPVIVCFAAHLMGLSDLITIFCTAMAALPSAASVTMFCEMYELEGSHEASQMVGTTSVLCLGTFPLIMLLADLICKI